MNGESLVDMGRYIIVEASLCARGDFGGRLGGFTLKTLDSLDV